MHLKIMYNFLHFQSGEHTGKRELEDLVEFVEKQMNEDSEDEEDDEADEV